VIFIPGISRTTVLIIIIAVSMFFGSLSNCCIGLRAYRIKEYGLKGEGSSKIQPNNGD
jgi:Mg2+/Co2+ transporter CorB